MPSTEPQVERVAPTAGRKILQHMSGQDSPEAVRAAVTLALLAAPTGTEQIAFARIVTQMAAAGEGDWTTVLALLRAVVDGLANGNWPTLPEPEPEEVERP